MEFKGHKEQLGLEFRSQIEAEMALPPLETKGTKGVVNLALNRG